MEDSIAVDGVDGVEEDDLVQCKAEIRPLLQRNNPTSISSILQETSVPSAKDMATGNMNVPHTGKVTMETVVG